MISRFIRVSMLGRASRISGDSKLTFQRHLVIVPRSPPHVQADRPSVSACASFKSRVRNHSNYQRSVTKGVKKGLTRRKDRTKYPFSHCGWYTSLNGNLTIPTK